MRAKSIVASVALGGILGVSPPSWAQVQVTQQPAPATTVVTQPASPPATTVVTQPAPQPATTVVTPPAPAPAVVQVEGRRRIGLIGGGIAMFTVPYLITVITAAAVSDVCQADSSLGCTSARWPIYIPVIGPFIQMGYVNGNGSNTARALLAIDGVVQGGGLAMLVTGIVLKATAPRALASRHFQLSPFSASAGTGLFAMGSF